MTRPLPPDWEKRRALVLERDPLCKADRCAEPSKHVDHIVPRAFGGSDAPDNLQGLCGSHHAQKTYREQADPFAFVDDPT